MFAKKTPKGETIDKTPYSSYYPHDTPIKERKWTDNFRQFISIDPARKNLGFRIERRSRGTGGTGGVFGAIETLAFNKISIEEITVNDNITYNNTYENLTKFLDDHEEYYDDVHYVILERQLPENYKATRIAQHIISYFSIKLHNRKLCPSIIEVAPQLKGRMLNVPKGTNAKELKKWAVVEAREILTDRDDEFALNVLDFYSKKADDLSDTVLQLEAILRYWQQNNIERAAYTFPIFLKLHPAEKTAPRKIILQKKN